MLYLVKIFFLRYKKYFYISVILSFFLTLLSVIYEISEYAESGTVFRGIVLNLPFLTSLGLVFHIRPKFFYIYILSKNYSRTDFFLAGFVFLLFHVFLMLWPLGVFTLLDWFTKPNTPDLWENTYLVGLLLTIDLIMWIAIAYSVKINTSEFVIILLLIIPLLLSCKPVQLLSFLQVNYVWIYILPGIHGRVYHLYTAAGGLIHVIENLLTACIFIFINNKVFNGKDLNI